VRRLKMRKDACLQAESSITRPQPPSQNAAISGRCDAHICLFEDYIDGRLFSVTADQMKVCPLANKSAQNGPACSYLVTKAHSF